MKKEEIEKLEEKYFSGQTNLQEEAKLFGTENHIEPGLSIWYRFIRAHKKTASSSIQQDVWANIERKTKAKRRRLVVGILAAATVVSFILSAPFFFSNQEMNHEEKVALLEEALSLFPEETKIEPDVIYEDEMVMIYTSLE